MGYLSSRTWGTWDIEEYDDDDPSTSSCSRISRKRIIPKAKERSKQWFEEILERIPRTSRFHVQSLPLVYASNPFLCPECQCLASGRCHSSRSGGTRPETCTNPNYHLHWPKFPPGVHPKYGHLSSRRSRNKIQQIENLLVVIQRYFGPHGRVQSTRGGSGLPCYRVVEFCAGSGFVSLPLAALFPHWTFLLLDLKEHSLAIAHSRIQAAGLTNVQCQLQDINDFNDTFDLGIALHACGPATDIVLSKCLQSQAAYVLAPCCIGKINVHSDIDGMTYPRSRALAQYISKDEYKVLVKAADYNNSIDSGEEGQQADMIHKYGLTKSLVELDRNAYAAEQRGYSTCLYRMHPVTASPKNDILFGAIVDEIQSSEENTNKRCCLQLHSPAFFQCLDS